MSINWENVVRLEGGDLCCFSAATGGQVYYFDHDVEGGGLSKLTANFSEFMELLQPYSFDHAAFDSMDEDAEVWVKPGFENHGKKKDAS